MKRQASVLTRALEPQILKELTEEELPSCPWSDLDDSKNWQRMHPLCEDAGPMAGRAVTPLFPATKTSLPCPPMPPLPSRHHAAAFCGHPEKRKPFECDSKVAFEAQFMIASEQGLAGGQAVCCGVVVVTSSRE